MHQIKRQLVSTTFRFDYMLTYSIILQQFFDDCNGVDHVSVPRKLRSGLVDFQLLESEKQESRANIEFCILKLQYVIDFRSMTTCANDISIILSSKFSSFAGCLSVLYDKGEKT